MKLLDKTCHTSTDAGDEINFQEITVSLRQEHVFGFVASDTHQLGYADEGSHTDGENLGTLIQPQIVGDRERQPADVWIAVRKENEGSLAVRPTARRDLQQVTSFSQATSHVRVLAKCRQAAQRRVEGLRAARHVAVNVDLSIVGERDHASPANHRIVVAEESSNNLLRKHDHCTSPHVAN